MARRTGKRQRQAQRKNATVHPAVFLAGTLAAIVGVVSSLLLVLEHLGGLSLPGCGEGGACSDATNSIWGKVTLGAFQWPVSYLGLAYFIALTGTWVFTRGRLPALIRFMVRLGIAGSIFFSIIMLTKSMPCPYCIATHIGNLAFWMLMEINRRPTPKPKIALGNFAAFFLITSGILGIWDSQHRAAVAAAAEEDMDASVQQMIESSHRPAPEVTANDSVDDDSRALAAADTETDGDTTATDDNTDSPPTPDAPLPDQPFTGRYRWGPEKAAIRLVIITDYQCPDCRKIEKQAERLMNERDDISLSIKHFPFCPDCNPKITRNLHPNACWAARAAEAAGILWGDEGFFKMHLWLFEHRGRFTKIEQLAEAFHDPGYDPQRFAQLIMSEETLDRVQADVEEAVSLGLHYTPMIFINAVELKGWNAPNALIRAVERVAASDPPPRTAEADRPPTALQKYVSDWRVGFRRGNMPEDSSSWSLGPADAPIHVIVWGDHEEQNSATVDELMREKVASRGDVRYTFRPYPFSSTCNEHISSPRHPYACRAARAVEAAGRLGGDDVYWAMHTWLMEHFDSLSDAVVRGKAVQLGLDPETLFAEMEKPEVAAAIDEDIQAGKRLGVRGIPWIFVDNRRVPRWQLNGDPIFDEIFAELTRSSED